MEPITYRFSTGVSVVIDMNQISARDSSGRDKIQLINFDSFHYEKHIEPKIPPAALDLIPFVVGFLFLLIGAFAGNFFKIIGYVLIVISILGFIFNFFDSLLFTGLSRKLIAKYFSYKGYAVTIGNKSGNNIIFYTNLDEIDKIKKLGLLLDELKELYMHSDTHQHKSSSNNGLDEIRKLGDLLNEGLITQEEFQIKKKQILGL